LHRKINEMKVADENGGNDRDRQKDKALQP